MDCSSPISRYLVTGSSGFIGSRLTKTLISQRNEVWWLDILPAPKIISKDYHHTQLDLTAKGAEIQIAKLLNDHDIQVVIHLASLIKVGEGESQPDRYKLVNVQGTKVVLRAMKTAGLKKIVFASSAAVYKTPAIKPNSLSSRSITTGMVVNSALKEDDPLGPVSVYGKTKLVAERLIRAYTQADEFEAVILRFFSVGGGKEMHQPPVHLIPIIIEKLVKGEPIQIFGKNYPTPDGTCYRDYFHVNDLINAILMAIRKWNQIMSIGCISPTGTKTVAPDKYERGLKIYNLGQGQGYTVLQVCKQVSQRYFTKYASDKPPEERLGSIVFVERRKGDPPILLANCSKAKIELGWTAYKSLGQIIKDTLNEMVEPKTA